MNAFLAVLAASVVVAVVFLLMSLLVWWLVPLAFPALTFGFTNAMALTLLALLFAMPASLSN